MVTAFAPGNISCIFVIKNHENPRIAGSLGVGFTVDKGVYVTINKKSLSKNSIIYFNNKKIKFPTVDSVISKLNKENIPLEIKIKSELPIGSGFGVSGASALATAYVLNKLFGLKKSKKELAIAAHTAEVENGTGLGDVVNQFYGGFLLKKVPSSRFKVIRLPIKNKVVYYKVFGELDTKKVISNKKIKNMINKAGFFAISRIKSLKKPSLKEIIKISKEFAVQSELLSNKIIINIIKKINKKNGSASMIMLGNSVFSDVPFEGCKKVKISDKGAHIIQ